MTPNSNRQGIGTLLFILTGPIVWAAHLALIYSSQSSLCSFDPGEGGAGGRDAIAAIILAVTAVGVAAVGSSAFRARSAHGLTARADLPAETITFIVTIMRVLAALSILAMLYAGLGVVFLPACDSLR
ncbi:MAG: hypothetical protein L0H15_00730 [Nitrosospira sp.]|nr:hypothetical protein [Nitrosospira sp.]